MFLDKDFWIALSKGLNWPIWFDNQEPCKNHTEKEDMSDHLPGWVAQWIKFILHLAEGGTPEDYFSTLTN